MLCSSIVVSLMLLMVALDIALGSCGQRKVLRLDLIHFGNRSKAGEWPWHAALFHQYNGASSSYACGGTIISRTFIITAAHCTFPTPRVRPLLTSEISVRVGISSIHQLEDTFQEMMVATILRHEHYNTVRSYNDIALLQLVSELKFTDYVSAICQWKGSDAEDAIVGKEGYVPGWGQDERGSLPDALKHAVMPVVSRQTCRDSDPIYYTNYLFDRRTFCAGFRNRTSVGPGDSGSGLYIENNGEWMLRGIVSNGKLKPITYKLDTESYIVFTDVEYYQKWIRSKIGIQVFEDLEPVEDYSVCGEKADAYFARPGLEDTRTWPWKGYLFYDSVRLCQVVIISEYFLLYPHFSIPKSYIVEASNLTAVFETDKSNVVARQQIEEIIRNKSMTMDIALLRMKAPLRFTRFIRPICIFREDSFEGALTHQTGFTSQVEVTFDSDICIEHFFEEFEMMEDYSFCFWLDRISSRLLDFTYIKRYNKWFLYGIPFSIKRGINTSKGYPVLSHYVSHYKDWIDMNTKLKFGNLLGNEDCSETEHFVFEIYSNNVFRCFATQIAPGVLITTAFCVDKQPLKHLRGTVDYGAGVFMFGINTIILHTSYDSDKLMNNIALIQYCPFQYNVSICLPAIPEKIRNIPLRAGLTKTITESSTSNITITNTKLCAESWQPEGINIATDGSNLCGRMPVLDSASQSCSGNHHGMPLVYSAPNTTETFLRGILDIGKSDRCKDDGFSEVYIDVTFYADWIIKQVENIRNWCEETTESNSVPEAIAPPAQKKPGFWENLKDTLFGG